MTLFDSAFPDIDAEQINDNVSQYTFTPPIADPVMLGINSLYFVMGGDDLLLSAIVEMPAREYERLARAVIRGYNWRHPRRKRSWRRLNKNERMEVFKMFVNDR